MYQENAKELLHSYLQLGTRDYILSHERGKGEYAQLATRLAHSWGITIDEVEVDIFYFGLI